MATFIQTKKGWRAQVLLGRDESRRSQFVSQSFDTKKEATDWATGIEAKRNDGALRITLSKQTLASFLRDSWLPMYATQVRSTYNASKVLGKWVINPKPELGVPFLGRIPLRKLGPGDFTKLYLAMAKGGMRHRGITHLHGLLHRALKHAMTEGYLPSNPVAFAKVPKPDVRGEIKSADDEDESEVEYLTLEQTKRFRAAAATIRERAWQEHKQALAEGKDPGPVLDLRYVALWLLLLDAGLRPGEALALNWRHIDFEHSLVKVRGSLTRLRNDEREEKGQSWMVTKPKTKSSNGDVPVRAETMRALKEWRAQQNALRLKLGREFADRGFVFTAMNGEPLGNNLRRSWIQVLRIADGGVGDLGEWGAEPKKPKSGPTRDRPFTPRYSPYVLRHTCATLLLIGKMPLLEVSRRLRHKNLNITAQFYGHIGPEHTTQASEIWDRLLGS